jgi:16S rRNA processing protein RimM
MAKTEYFELGTLSKPHGLKGAFHLYLDVDDPYEYEDLDAIFLQQGNGSLFCGGYPNSG